MPKTNEIPLELPNIERCWGAVTGVHNSSSYYKSQLKLFGLSWDFLWYWGRLGPANRRASEQSKPVKRPLMCQLLLFNLPTVSIRSTLVKIQNYGNIVTVPVQQHNNSLGRTGGRVDEVYPKINSDDKTPISAMFCNGVRLHRSCALIIVQFTIQ